MSSPLLEAPEGLVLVGDSRTQRDSQPQAARRARRSRGNGFDSDPLRQQLELLGASHCIPSKSNRHKKHRLNKNLCRQRYKVENYFCRLKRCASASTRRDKLAVHFLALIQFASVINCLRYGC